MTQPDTLQSAAAAARNMLLLGQHFGRCQPGEDGRCAQHAQTLAARSSALARALVMLDETAARG